MGIKAKRKNLKHGRYSRAIVLPANVKKGVESTLAADRLILVDPRAEISEDALLEFLETVIEPAFWPWLKARQTQEASSVAAATIERSSETQ